MLKFKRVRAGLYRAELNGNVYEVERDIYGYDGVTEEEREGDGLLAGCDDDGWSAASNDETLDWFPTKRQAVAYLNKRVEKLVPKHHSWCDKLGDSWACHPDCPVALARQSQV